MPPHPWEFALRKGEIPQELKGHGKENIFSTCSLPCLYKPKSWHRLREPTHKTQLNPRAFQVVKLHKNCHVFLAMGERLLVTYDHPPWYTPSLWV